MKKIIETAVKEIEQSIADVKGVYLFGSLLTEYAKKDSDIDLAVLSDHTIDPVRLWELSQKIAVMIQKNVDLIDLTNASTVLRYQIISSGKRIMCKDDAVCNHFETLAISRYLRFNEARAGIIQDIKTRGSIY